jgi:cysteine desulfurase/selenocysteine lyase
MPGLDIERIRADFPVLQRQVHGKPLVYLDSAATSQKPQAMIDAMVRLYSQYYARAEEEHELSKEATEAFEGVRKKVAKLINAAEAREVIFTRGATEALNLVANAFGDGVLSKGDVVLLTEAEHHSNIVPWLLACERSGASIQAVPLNAHGDVDLDRLERMLSDRVKVLGITHLSNVTGGVQDVKAATEMAHARGIPVLVDGAQAVPHIPVDVHDIGCDFYTGAGHKMGGPSSVGFLWGKAERLEKLPVGDGGSMMSESVSFDGFTPKPLPFKYEAGEPAFGEVAAWGAAIDYWAELGMERIAAYERDLTAYAVSRLQAIAGVRVLARPADRVAVISFVVEGKEPSKVSQALDRQGIAVRAGKLAAQPMLQALGVEEAVRASFMFYNTRAEADALASALEQIAG